MKVLMTTDNIGGVWTFSTDLARGLRKLGAEVILAVIGEPLTESQKELLIDIQYQHYVAPQEWMENPWEEVYAAGQWLYWIKQIENPDIIHFNSYTLACINWQVPVAVTIHSCVLSWWEAVKNEQAPISWDMYRWHIKTGIQSADFITAPTKSMLNVAEKFYGPFRSQRVIYNGRDRDLFQPRQKKKFIFSMGRLWDEAKNIKLLVEAAKFINYQVFIAGEFEEKSLNNLPSNVTLLGKLTQHEIAQWLSEAWIYALPAKYEPFGYSFVEAAFSGCTLIGGDIPSLHEVWNEAMIYTQTNNAAQLAGLINQLMDNETYLSEMGKQAYNHAMNHYALEQMAYEYFKLYKRITTIKSNLLQH